MIANKIYKDVMVDLETLGKRAGCAILSIGAIPFNESSVATDKPFYQAVRRSSCERAGLHIDPSTLLWWEGQEAEAKKALTDAKGTKNNMQLHLALQSFNDYLSQFGGDVRVWGNGSDFDNAILYAAYAAVGVEPHWSFWNSRCFRTLKGLYPSIKQKRKGVYHNALDDAITQAEHAVQILKYMKT